MPSEACSAAITPCSAAYPPCRRLTVVPSGSWLNCIEPPAMDRTSPQPRASSRGERLQQHGRRRRRAEADEKARGMKSQLDGLGRVGGCAHAADCFVAGADRGSQALAIEAVMGGQRQAGGDDRGARMADRLVVGVVELQSVGRCGVDEGGERRSQADLRRQQRRVSGAGVGGRPFVQPPAPGQQRARIAAAEMIEDQVPDLPEVTAAQRRVADCQ